MIYLLIHWQQAIIYNLLNYRFFISLWQGSWRVELWRGHRSLFVFEAVGKSSNTDNYVDCSQCPGIYGRTPAIYDRWRHQWELVNDMKQADLLLSTPISDLYFISDLGKKFPADQFQKWEKNVAPDVFCKLEKFAIHRKTFLVTSQTFLKRWCLFPLRSPHSTVLLLQTLKRSENYEIFENGKEWHVGENSEIRSSG